MRGGHFTKSAISGPESSRNSLRHFLRGFSSVPGATRRWLAPKPVPDPAIRAPLSLGPTNTRVPPDRPPHVGPGSTQTTPPRDVPASEGADDRRVTHGPSHAPALGRLGSAVDLARSVGRETETASQARTLEIGAVGSVRRFRRRHHATFEERGHFRRTVTS
jgi:hypothetical protein